MMSDLKFTPAQQDAIEARGGSIIVSAAAGSGKTRVLVQRVIKQLTDKEHPVDADKMLIVTFTKAAAEEMRSRISAAIEELLISEPDNNLLRRQQLLLANSDICTIHSFCSRMIRENFYMLDINQDFRIASEGESEILKNRVMSEIIERKYAENTEGFKILSELLSDSRSDSHMEKSLLSVYESSSAHPFPDMWLDIAEEFYDPEIPLMKTVFAGIALDVLSSALAFIRGRLDEAAGVIENNEAFCTGTSTCGMNKLTYLKNFSSGLEAAALEKDWDKISECVSSFKKHPYRKPSGKKNFAAEEECNIVKGCFDNIEETILKELIPLFAIKEYEYIRDVKTVYPAVICMCDILKEFDSQFFEAKKERGILDFSDLEHLMINLLVEKNESGMKKTDFAKSISEQYECIMVDEYQDTNETQECIFRFISRDEQNLFVVGDVKQSIYRFREAMPEIFKKRRKSSVLYDRSNPCFPAKIILDKNFRSREGIIDSINFVFRCIMSEQVGEIDYNDEEKLTAGAEYPQAADPETEVHLLDLSSLRNTGSDDDEAQDAGVYETEAAYIARRIKRMVSEKQTITDSGIQRRVNYGDFAVLMRYLSSNGQTYVDVLNKFGVPAYIDKPYSLFNCYEVNVAISLLKITDNPMQDIPMLSVLLCPVFGFTADELSELKANYKGRSIYNRLVLCTKNKSEQNLNLYGKCKNFIAALSELRRLSVILKSSELFEYFIEKTAFASVISAMDNGNIRLRNLKKFMSFIMDYESSGKRKLTDLMRHISYLEENGTEISAGDSAPADSVKIMSIHHSKGLEFPVCILAGLFSKGSNISDEILCHNDLGLGFKTIDRDNMLKFNTLQRNIIKYCKDKEEQSEAMRVLYVAMTRAKEKLLAVISINSRSSDGFEKKLNKLASMINIVDGRISPYTAQSGSSLADWLLMCALVHPDMKALRDDANADQLEIIPTKSRWSYYKVRSFENEEKTAEEPSHVYKPDEEILDFLKKRFSQNYQYSERTLVPSKVSASTLVHSDMQLYHIAEARPAFMQENSMTGAEKGTAMHTFLQYADFDRLIASPEKEIERVRSEGFISQEQSDVIKTEDIKKFTQSSIYSHLCRAEKIYREYRFTVNIKASDVDRAFTCDENVILQGAMDCLIIEDDGMIVVDYKTDKVKNIETLSERYSKQLVLYKKAAEQLFELPVKKCVIYSVYRGEEIEIQL